MGMKRAVVVMEAAVRTEVTKVAVEMGIATLAALKFAC